MEQVSLSDVVQKGNGSSSTTTTPSAVGELPQSDLLAENEQQKLTLHTCPPFVTVKFITRTHPHHTPETPFKIPSSLSRYGLSEIVNHLLGNEDRKSIVPFEFLVRYKNKKIFLRTTLRNFYVLSQRWPEEIDTLEYIEAQPAPRSVDQIPHDDWLSHIVNLRRTEDGMGKRDYLVTSCYDGKIRVIDSQTGSVLGVHRHARAALAVDCRRITMVPDDLTVISGGQNEKVHYYRYDSERRKFEMKCLLTGHEAPVNAISINPSGSLVFTASTDRTIQYWSLTQKALNMDEHYMKILEEQQEDDDASNIQEPASKKRKLQIIEQPSIDVFNGHTLGVNALAWKDNTQLFSGSDDHTILLWDIHSRQPVTKLQGSKVVSALSYNQELGVILSTHPDGAIRMWDPRAEDATAQVFRSHKGWVRSVDWARKPGLTYQFTSGADDNLIKIWDVRSAIPLHSFSHHKKSQEEKEEIKQQIEEDKKFREMDTLVRPMLHAKRARSNFKTMCVTYAQGSNSVIYSGSSDCTVKKHVIENKHAEEAMKD
uniref:NLE domain-containing protein n=1 Tax=Percolomonas cosmopolitus TaxID=63605 RepID=A0A7S1KSZ3_9EUKA|mmetsp:Transcript_8308/g.30672  ORF Transcript_8308/g.30672 Transcript_8308/m.30672 type:complete len:540 (+) Transcript_8308:160-1779(+)